MGETSRTARCHRSPIRLRSGPSMSAPRSIRLTLALFVLAGVAAAIGATPADPAAASPDAVPAVRGGGVQVVSGAGELSSVACATSSSCVAVGSMNGEGVVVPIDDGVPGPAQALPGTEGLVSVACTSARSCIAVGTELYSDEPMPPWTVGVFVGIDDGQAFVGGPITGNGLPGSPDYVYPSGVACSGGTHYCVAVGGATYEGGFGVDIGKGGSSVVQSINPFRINGVECANDGWCLADGQEQAEFVQIVNGNLRLGPSVGFSDHANLNSGACHALSRDFCVVAGASGRKPGRGDRLLRRGRVVWPHPGGSRNEHLERFGMLGQLLVCRRRSEHGGRRSNRPGGLGESRRGAIRYRDRRVRRGQLSDAAILRRRGRRGTAERDGRHY